jgi:hypothetical protein
VVTDWSQVPLSAAATQAGSSVDVAAVIGDVLVFVALVVAVIGVIAAFRIYRGQQYDSDLRQIGATRSLMSAVRDGIQPWGDEHFRRSYDGRPLPREPRVTLRQSCTAAFKKTSAYPPTRS